jgi:hypothetical protein
MIGDKVYQAKLILKRGNVPAVDPSRYRFIALALKRAQVTSPEQAQAMSDDELLAIGNFGARSLVTLRGALRSRDRQVLATLFPPAREPLRPEGRIGYHVTGVRSMTTASLPDKGAIYTVTLRQNGHGGVGRYGYEHVPRESEEHDDVVRLYDERGLLIDTRLFDHFSSLLANGHWFATEAAAYQHLAARTREEIDDLLNRLSNLNDTRKLAARAIRQAAEADGGE